MMYKYWILLIAVGLLLIPTNLFVPDASGADPDESEAYRYLDTPPDSFGVSKIKVVNWDHFKDLFLAHTDWMLEYKRYESSSWTDGLDYLTIERSWNDAGFWKFNLILDVPVDIYSARFTFGIDIPALDYIERDGYEVWINYTANATEIYSVLFNWSDIAGIPGVVITKGILGDLFWFRFRRDNIPVGRYEFDPFFGDNSEGGGNRQLENVIEGSSFLFTFNGDYAYAKNISAFVFTQDVTFNMTAGLYLNATDVLVKQSEIKSVDTGGVHEWVVFNFSTDYLLINNTQYLIVCWSNLSADGASVIRRNDAVNVWSRRDALVWTDGVLSNPFVNDNTFTTTNNIYCSYNIAPVLSNENPSDGDTGISVSTDLSITIEDPDGDRFNYSWHCSDGSGGVVNEETNGTKTLVLDGDLSRCTLYTWWVNATDGNNTMNSSYSFTTDCPIPADGYELAWNETLTQLCAYISDVDGDGMEYTISQDDVVLESGGNFVYINTTINFTDTVNNSAHWENSKGSLDLTSVTEFTTSEYENISSVNGSGVNTSGCSPTIWSHHNFSFDLSSYDSNDITNIDINWYGYAGYNTGGAKPKWYWDATMYVKKGNWGGGVNSTPSPYTGSPVNEWFNYSTDNSFIQGDGTLLVAVENTLTGECSRVYTDYIEIIITTISGGVGNGTYCTSNVSWWNDDCGVIWTWEVYVNDGRGTSSTTTYTFYNAPCTFSGSIYPATGATDVCPCCDAICVDVTAGYNFNMTVYGREQGDTYFSIWNAYTNISADEYCFCMDAITPTNRPHVVVHSHTQQAVTTLGLWQNVTFDDGMAIDIEVDIVTGTITILSHGMYTATYWAAVHDDDANPTGNKMAIRIYYNNDSELDGSYRELEFTKQGKEQHLSGFFHGEFYEGDTLCFQYVGGDTDQHIDTHGTWSDDDISFYAYVEKIDMEESHPLMYNTTYEWYVNVSKFDNSSLYNETGVFSFTTASNYSECVDDVGGGVNRGNSMWVIGLCGLFSFPLSYILYIKLNRRRNKNNNQGMK